METYHTWVRMFELQRYYSWIIDRFHISTRAFQLKNNGEDYEFTWLEQRMKPLGFHLVFVTRTKDSFDAARHERIKVSGNPSQYDDLSIFVQEQDAMHELVVNSILPVLNLDISDNHIPDAVNRIADWLESTGGLWME